MTERNIVTEWWKRPKKLFQKESWNIGGRTTIIKTRWRHDCHLEKNCILRRRKKITWTLKVKVKVLRAIKRKFKNSQLEKTDENFQKNDTRSFHKLFKYKLTIYINCLVYALKLKMGTWRNIITENWHTLADYIF